MSGAGGAATGSQLLLAMGRSRPGVFSVPAPGARFIRAIPNIEFGMTYAEGESPELNPRSFMEQGIPGAVVGKSDYAERFTPGSILELLENVFRHMDSTDHGGYFEYYAEPDKDAVQSDLWFVYAADPVDQWVLYGAKAGGISFEFGDDGKIDYRPIDMVPVKGTRLGVAVADVGNAGAYALGPWASGKLRWPELGPVHVSVVSDAAGAQSVTFHQTADAPTFPADAIEIAFDPFTDNEHCWQSAQGAIRLPGSVTVVAGQTALTGDGANFAKYLSPGIKVQIGAEVHFVDVITDDDNAVLRAAHVAGAAAAPLDLLNRDLGQVTSEPAVNDPLQFVFPGKEADHVYVAGDAWTFPVVWPAQAAIYEGVGGRLNKTHARLVTREKDSDPWYANKNLTGKIELRWSVSTETAENSTYSTDTDRDGLMHANLEFSRTLRDLRMAAASEHHKRLQWQLSFLGEQLGDGTHREGLIFEGPSAAVTESTRPVAGAAKIAEGYKMMAHTNDNGDPPVTCRAFTRRQYVPLSEM